MKYILFAVVLSLLFIGCTTQTIVTYRTLDVTENPIGARVGQIDRTEGGILEAARNGGITRISTLSVQNTERYQTNYLPMILMMNPTVTLLSREEVIIVTGE